MTTFFKLGFNLMHIPFLKLNLNQLFIFTIETFTWLFYVELRAVKDSCTA